MVFQFFNNVVPADCHDQLSACENELKAQFRENLSEIYEPPVQHLITGGVLSAAKEHPYMVNIFIVTFHIITSRKYFPINTFEFYRFLFVQPSIIYQKNIRQCKMLNVRCNRSCWRDRPHSTHIIELLKN